jgi:hypothetical protein
VVRAVSGALDGRLVPSPDRSSPAPPLSGHRRAVAIHAKERHTPRVPPHPERRPSPGRKGAALLVYSGRRSAGLTMRDDDLTSREWWFLGKGGLDHFRAERRPKHEIERSIKDFLDQIGGEELTETERRWARDDYEAARRRLREECEARRPEEVRGHVLFATALRGLSPERTKRFLDWIRSQPNQADDAGGSCR